MSHFVERCIHGARGATCKCGGPGRETHLIPCPPDCNGEDNEYAMPKTEWGRQIIQRWEKFASENWSCEDGKYTKDWRNPFVVENEPTEGAYIGPSISAIWTPHEHVPEYSAMKCGYHCSICWEMLSTDEDRARMFG